jgi:RNA polymerase sigma-70 factor (ECF subfamily)
VPKDTPRSASQAENDWLDVVARIRRGDRVAFVSLARFVTGTLSGWRAFDFRDDWDDMVQEVVLAVVGAHREGRLESDGAVAGFVRQTARFKFVDRLRALGREAPGRDAADLLEAGESPWPPSGAPALSPESRLALREAIGRLDERPRAAVVEVYMHGRTYDEAAAVTGIPLGSLKRHLREGLALLREALGEGR